MILGLLTFLVVFYTVFIMAAIFGWLKLPKTQVPENYRPTASISVLIAVRNEAASIQNLINDLARQNYPPELFEVIFIDDFSEDHTVALIKEFMAGSTLKIKLLNLQNGRGEGKKSALAFGLEQASGNLIVQTDGDCRVQPNWLLLFEHFYRTTGAKFISGPVCLNARDLVFEKMQVVEFASLIGTGAATIGLHKPTMCNGANLGYEKATFYEVNGFAGNEQIPSGDDEFLMHKIHKKYPGKVRFLKANEATVFTAAQTKFPAFVAQRVRWASKWKFYQNPVGQMLAFLVFGVNLMLLVGFGAYLNGNIAGAAFWTCFLLKSGGDVVFLALILTFHQRLHLLLYSLPLQLVYVPYVLYCALAGLTGNYRWKGRNLRTS